MKMKTKDPDILKFFGDKCKQVKLKKARELQRVLNLAEKKISEILERKAWDKEE
jgi:hypothetical protein